MNEYCDYLAKISRKISMKKLFMLLCIGLLFTACAQQTKNETDMDFVDNVKEALADSGRIDLNSLQWTREPGGFEVKGNGTPLQYSCLENPMDGGAWWAAVHGVTKSRTRLSDFTLTFPLSCVYVEKAMATHSSTLAWKIPWTEEPGRLQSMGPQRVGHD